MSVSTSAARAAASLLDGRQRVRMIAAMAPRQPDALLAASIQYARRHGIELTILFGDTSGQCSFVTQDDADLLDSGQLRLICLAGGVPRWLGPHADFFPNGLFDLDRWIADGTVAVDMAVAQVTACAGGGFDLGDMIGYTPAALERAVSVGFEVLPGGIPAGYPARWEVPVDRPDAVCAAETRAARPGAAARTAEREQIGKLVGELVPDDATLELGIGAVPEAVIPHLARKRELGLHSGILPAALRAPVAAGAFAASAKTSARGRHVATGILGSDGDWGEQVQLQPLSVTHAPAILAQQHRFWAINSAMEVDLLGQVNAEYAAGIRVASSGGQADFFRAAHLNPGGAAVLAIPARTGSGRGRIVARIRPPHAVATMAADLDIAVTEYGYAQLSGATAAERVSRMIAIAHPDDRKTLQREWDNGD
jgi:4-hydroxybutyrate CoA-transferase